MRLFVSANDSNAQEIEIESQKPKTPSSKQPLLSLLKDTLWFFSALLTFCPLFLSLSLLLSISQTISSSQFRLLDLTVSHRLPISNPNFSYPMRFLLRSLIASRITVNVLAVRVFPFLLSNIRSSRFIAYWISYVDFVGFIIVCLQDSLCFG